jgi:Uma2 family endonuclease
MGLAMTDWIPRHRITVDEYYRMAEEGILRPDARVELIEGEIIDMAPIGIRHGGSVLQLNRLLTSAVGDLAFVSAQSAVRLSSISEPQPDFALLRPRRDFYKTRHPTAADTFLVIEVSDTTLRYDLRVKVPLYARHEIPEVWLVDVEGKQLRVFRSPNSGEYTDATSIDNPAVLTLHALDTVKVNLAGLFED